MQLAGIGLMLISLGAIWKKITAWHTGFWGEIATLVPRVTQQAAIRFLREHVVPGYGGVSCSRTRSRKVASSGMSMAWPRSCNHRRI